MSQRFCDTDYGTAATATTSADATGYAAANAQNAARWKRWRSSTTTGNQNYDLDFGSSKTITFVALVDVTGHTGGTVKGQYWTGAVWVDLGTFAFSAITGVGVLWVNQATQKIRILFTNTGAVNAYVEIGVIRVGQYFQPARQFAPGALMSRQDPTQFSTSIDGQKYAQQRTRYYRVTGQITLLDGATQRDRFFTMYETLGVFAPFFFAFDHAAMDRCLYGRFDMSMDAGHVSKTVDYWNVPIAVAEER